MMEQNDHELLSEFARGGCESAFTTLVRRYVNLVYSTALRCTRNSAQAEEITQVVFIILARKAAGLGRGTVLSGWLYQATRLTAGNFVRSEIRRQRREEEVQMQAGLNEEPEMARWEEIAPLLDEGLGGLSKTDRNAVVLRYFENKTAAEVGEALRLTEAAAHKRCSRALEKLRRFFTKRGVTLSLAAMAGAISANSVQAAPASLAATITAVTVQGASIGGSTLILLKGALKVMAWAKAKLIIGVAAGVLLAAGAGGVAVMKLQEASQLEEERAHEGITRMQLTGTAGAVITGFYVQNGQRVELSNSLPWSFEGTNVSRFEFHKANQDDTVRVVLSYDGNGAHARMTKNLNTQYTWLEGKVRYGLETVSYPK